MELREFIEASLFNIVEGVQSANLNLVKESEEKPFRVMKGYEGYVDKIKGQNPGFIYFDVAVSAISDSLKGGKAGIFIKVVELGGKLESAERNESISRIKFCIGANKEIT